MTLTNEQRNIVNPNANTLSEPQGLPVRSGVGYDYSQIRNKFIIDVIHESYNSYYEFPPDGFELLVGPSEGVTYTIELVDLLAYCAMYPQNGKIQRQENGSATIVSISEEEANAQLNLLDNQLGEQNNYYSDTAPLSFDPENTNQRYKLVFIDPNHSAEYVALMRRALGKEGVEPLNPEPTLNNTVLPPELTTFISSDSTVDLDNWLVNCQPGTENKKTYFNSRDQRFYYTQRTKHTSPDYYDLSYYYPDDPEFDPYEDDLDDEAQAAYNTIAENLEKALATGVEAILKSVGKFSQSNKNNILNSSPKKAYIMPYLDIRPASRWCFCVQIERSVINDLEDVDVVSYEEDELWILEKAQTLANPQKSPIAYRQTFIFDDLMDYIRSTQRMLELFAEDMAEEGIFSLPLANSQITRDGTPPDPDSRSGLLFLEDEIARLNGFSDFLQTFFTYNKRSLLPETVVEFFLDAEYKLLHICANGELLTRGLGNTNYIKRSENDQVGKILNAFSFLTSTTFSYLMQSREIHEKFLAVAPGGVGFASGEEWSTFIPKYTYPPVIIDPDSIKIAHKENEELRKRKDALFVRLSKVLDVSPQQAERLYQNKISDKKWVRQRVTELVKGVNCSTAQAQLANDVVGFWNAANEKNNVRALIRESIQLLRREISNDAVASLTIGGKRAELGTHDLLAGASRLNQQLDLDGTKRKDQGFGDALNVAYNSEANNALLLRQVESVINSQISCAIDSFGNVLQNGFLDPVGLPPDSGKLIAREIHKPIKFEIKKMKMISMKKDQSDYYWKIVDTAIQQLLKSLITGIARDVFAAALGCGPNPTQTDQLDNSLKRYDFGYSMLSEHVGGINLRQLAIDTGFVSPPLNEGDDVIPPSPEQLDAFLKDVSIMCTPAELQQLLFGEADNLLYELIYETVSNGTVKVKIGEEPADGFIAEAQRAVSGGEDGMVPIFHTIDPSVYANIIKTKDIIREFFAAIGDALIPGEVSAVDDMSFQSPLEAYCAGKNPNVEPLRLRIGIEQIQAQYVQVMDARIDKINSLCQWLQDLSQIEAIIGDIFDFLPLMEWYNTILELLAFFSNFIASAIAELWARISGEDPPNSSAGSGANNIYNTRMGVELFYQMREVLKTRPTHELVTLPGTQRPPLDDSYYNGGVSGDNLGSETLYVLGGSQGHYFYPDGPDGNREILGNPFINRGKIEYTQPNPMYLIGNQIAPLSSKPPLTLPYQPPGVRGVEQYQVSHYSSRVAPFSFRVGLFPEFADGEEPDYVTYSNQVLRKIANGAWKQVPYTGFISPIFLSAKSVVQGGYDLYGINVGVDKPSYEKLAHWNPIEEFDGDAVRFILAGNFVAEAQQDSGQPLTGINQPLSYGGLGGTSYGWADDNVYRPDLVTALPSVDNAEVQSLVNSFFRGYVATNRYSPVGVDEENILPLVSIANYTTTLERSLNGSYYNATGKRRLPQYVNAINRDALKVLDDRCVTRDDARKAHAILKVVQARMQKFFLNAMPFASAYPHWNNLSTRRLVCDYLANKIVKELTGRSLLGLVYANMDFVKKVYADEPENNFSFSSSNTPATNLREFIDAVYRGMLQNIAKYSEYEQIVYNAYSYYPANYVEKTGIENVTVDRYVVMLEAFFKKMQENLETRTITYGIPEDQIDNLVEFIEDSVINSGGSIKNIGHYYFPLGVLTATKLIYSDYSLNTSGRYSQANYRLLLESAGADDGLISAFRGVVSNQFSAPYRGFPQTILQYTQESEITYYNSIEVERRLNFLRNVETDLTLLVDNFAAIDYSPRQIASISQEEFNQTIFPVIENYIGFRPGQGGQGIPFFNEDRPFSNLWYENRDSVPLGYTYEQAVEVLKVHWRKILSAPNPTDGGDYTGEVRFHILTNPYQYENDPENSSWRAISKNAQYLNINADVKPGLYTPSEFFKSWYDFYANLQAANRSRRARGAVADLTQEQVRYRFLLDGETILFDVLQPLYQAAIETVQTTENLRTERNSLEKLIIE